MTNRHFQSAIGVPSGPPQSAIRATRAYALLLVAALLIGAGTGSTTPTQAESSAPSDPQVIIGCPATGCFADVPSSNVFYVEIILPLQAPRL